MTLSTRFVVLAVSLAIAAVIVSGSRTAAANDYNLAMTRCKMVLNMKGWSFLYKTMSGEGQVTCENGQSASVSIDSHAGGLTAGKTQITGGQGLFSDVTGVDEVLGTYVSAEVHAGATKSAQASAMTKGEVSLSISGTGRGIDLGFTMGAFTISRR